MLVYGLRADPDRYCGKVIQLTAVEGWRTCMVLGHGYDSVRPRSRREIRDGICRAPERPVHDLRGSGERKELAMSTAWSCQP